ncbi:MAG: hypothetical protein WBC98_06380 [Candidatus Zixiibacteriota bacterium]
MKPTIFLTVIGLFLIVPLSAASPGIGGAPLFSLTEETYDGCSFVIHQTTSVDERSSIVIQPARSAYPDQDEIRTKVEVLRRNGRIFQIPLPKVSSTADSFTTRVSIHLEEWAVEQGDKLHILIRHDLCYPYVFERYVAVRRHGISENLSFPFLSVQRSGDHPGSLGAGISYTMRYVQPERSLLNKIGFGMNLCLLDFDASQKVEVGLGFVVSFPDDLFHAGAGKNLTVKRNSGYYFLGVNLPAVKERIGL